MFNKLRARMANNNAPADADHVATDTTTANNNTTSGAPATTAAAPTNTSAFADEALLKKSKKKYHTPYALHRTRIILRALAFVAEFIAFFMQIGLVVKCYNGPHYNYYDSCPGPFELPVIAIPAIWCIAEFITLCVNRRGIHPGAHIAMDLIMFGLLLGPAVVLFIIWSPYYYPDSSAVIVGESGIPVGLASAAFMVIASLLHFTLFVIACIAVHRWRRHKHAKSLAARRPVFLYPGGPPVHDVAGAPHKMDPAQAYVITYPNGQQVLMPPQGQGGQQFGGIGGQQVQVAPAGSHQSFYAPQGQWGVQQPQGAYPQQQQPQSHLQTQQHPQPQTQTQHAVSPVGANTSQPQGVPGQAVTS